VSDEQSPARGTVGARSIGYAPESPMLDLLTGFINELREAGLPVSLTENLDAMEAVTHIPIADRDAFKYALGSTLVKNHTHWKAFEIVFEVYFSLRGPEYDLLEPALPLDELPEDAQTGEGDPDRVGQRGGGGNAMSPEELAEMLYQALLRGDNSLMRAIARQAVRRYAGMEPGRPVGGTYYLYRTLRNLDLDNVLERLLQATRQQTPEPMTALEERLEKDEFESRIDQLKNFGFVDDVTVVAPGINGKMSEFGAALGLLQLRHIDDAIARRRVIDDTYRELLGDIKGIRCLEHAEDAVSNFSYFPILVEPNFPMSREALYRRLRNGNIYTRRYFYPLITEFPMYRGLPSAKREALPVARDTALRVLCLPIYPQLGDDDVRRVVSCIRQNH